MNARYNKRELCQSQVTYLASGVNMINVKRAGEVNTRRTCSCVSIKDDSVTSSTEHSQTYILEETGQHDHCTNNYVQSLRTEAASPAVWKPQKRLYVILFPGSRAVLAPRTTEQLSSERPELGLRLCVQIVIAGSMLAISNISQCLRRV